MINKINIEFIGIYLGTLDNKEFFYTLDNKQYVLSYK